MKKAEAISILATSVRPREPKDRARYDEAVKMAIEALKCSETPKSSERAAESAQPDHVADISKKVDGDCISRQAAIDLFPDDALEWDTKGGYIAPHLARRMIEELPSAQPEERKKGAWISEGRIIRCNKCKIGYATVKGMKSALTYNFCPHCGADMRKDEEHDE